MSTIKRKLLEIAAELHLRRESTDVQDVIALVGLLLENAKDTFLKSSPENLVAVQAEAQAYAYVLKLITQPRPQMTKQEN
jgi:sensor histidine kinase regulating citrate/malate metabolism